MPHYLPDVNANEVPRAGAPGAPGIRRLNFTHHDLARWLLENPAANLGDAAQYFGYTRAWISCIIHSDAFRNYFYELQQQADRAVIGDIPARLRGIADAALEALSHELDQCATSGLAGRVDREFVKETADMALKALGFGGRGNGSAVTQPQAPQQNVIFAEKVVLQEARERMLARGRPTQGNSLESSGLESSVESATVLVLPTNDERRESV